MAFLGTHRRLLFRVTDRTETKVINGTGLYQYPSQPSAKYWTNDFQPSQDTVSPMFSNIIKRLRFLLEFFRCSG